MQAAWTVHDLDNCTVVAISGKLDLSAAPKMLAGFHSVCGARRRIVVDLTGITFIDCIGLGV
jgi:anti-anti-sigma factor